MRGEVGEPARTATLSRATPITIAIRSDFAWLARGNGDSDGEAREPLDASTARVLGCLRERGALFFAELRACSGLSEDGLQDALWDGVARGLVTADGFAALRSLLAPSPRWARARESATRRLGLRSGARGAQAGEGRWALVALPTAEPDLDPDVLAEAVVEQLLARWGVVFRDLLARESLAVSWRDAIWALRRLEARGQVRGGRFVSGFSGEQYALPDAVDLLRSVRRKERDGGELVRVNGCDPLNLVGILLPGARVPTVRTQSVTYRDGVLLEDAASTAQIAVS
jgi:ATP-dependent Lhr-like helicase